MIAPYTLKFPYYKGTGRQRECGFGATAQVIGRTSFPFLRKYVVRAADRVGVDFLETEVPGVVDVVSGKRNFKTATKSVGRQTLTKQIPDDRQKISLPVKNLKLAIDHVETILLFLENNNDRSK